ncbi:MAG: hypothetical protein AAGA48_21375 [Myxococcota bacterium]
MRKSMFIAIVAVACGGGGDYSVDDIEAGLVSGTIGGASWEMVEAQVEVDPFDANQLSIEVFAEDVDDCTFASSKEPFLLFSVDNQTGEYPLSFDLLQGGQTITIVEPPANNNIAAEGIIDLVVNEGSIEVGLVAFIDDDYNVNGSFTADICDSK